MTDPQTIALRILARKGDPDAIAELIRRWVDLRWDSRGADLTEYPYRLETQPYKTAWGRFGGG